MEKEAEAIELLKKLTSWYTDNDKRHGFEANTKPYWGAPDDKTIKEAWKQAAILTGLLNTK